MELVPDEWHRTSVAPPRIRVYSARAPRAMISLPSLTRTTAAVVAVPGDDRPSEIHPHQYCITADRSQDSCDGGGRQQIVVSMSIIISIARTASVRPGGPPRFDASLAGAVSSRLRRAAVPVARADITSGLTTSVLSSLVTLLLSVLPFIARFRFHATPRARNMAWASRGNRPTCFDLLGIT